MRSSILKLTPFSSLPAAGLDRLMRGAKEEYHKKGEVIFKEGDKAAAIWVIQEGWVRLIKQSDGEKAITIDLLTPREGLFGISSIDRFPYSASAIAATDCTLLRIPHQEIFNLMSSHSGFSQALLVLFCHRIRHMTEACAMLYEPAQRRIAKALLHLRASFGNVLPITHKEVAGITGLRVETTIRMMAKMKQKGLVTMSRGKIQLLAPEGIKALLVA